MLFKISETVRIVDACTVKVEVDLRFEMLCDQMYSKLVKIHVSLILYPMDVQQVKNIHPTPSIHCTGFARRICQSKLSVSKNMSDAFTTSATEP